MAQTTYNLLTFNSKGFQVKRLYDAPIATINGLTESSFYCFLANVNPWPLDGSGNPIIPVPQQDQKSIKNLYKNIFAVKQITGNNLSPVAQRIDWTTGVVYDYYRDNIDMFQKDINGFLIYEFYVKNRYDQVFKCLWNNNGAVSTNEPQFQPGQYGTNNIFVGPDDGYKWKYMYTIDAGRKNQFMDSNWMPVPVLQIFANAATQLQGSGGLEVINVVNGGYGYNTIYSPVNIVITGDGTGATANAVLSNGSITQVLVNTQGSNYSYANVSVSSANGTGAILTTAISPSGGHGFDLPDELGCSNIMITCEFQGTESNFVSANTTYTTIGLMTDPYVAGTVGQPANGAIYNTTTQLLVSSGPLAFSGNEIVYQGTSLATATFKGQLVDFSTGLNVLSVINTVGSLVINQPIIGATTGTSRTVLQSTVPNFLTYTGNIFYVENRAVIQRSADGIEQFKFVLGY
jgi:hypothetical protein